MRAIAPSKDTSTHDYILIDFLSLLLIKIILKFFYRASEAFVLLVDSQIGVVVLSDAFQVESTPFGYVLAPHVRHQTVNVEHLQTQRLVGIVL